MRRTQEERPRPHSCIWIDSGSTHPENEITPISVDGLGLNDTW